MAAGANEPCLPQLNDPDLLSHLFTMHHRIAMHHKQ
jgi:hypothetical protein